jgi:hypothetical protein
MKQYITLFFIFFTLLFTCSAQKTGKNSEPDSIRRVVNLKQVTVVGQLHKGNSNYEFTTEKTKSLITLIGENDAIRYIGTLPGVTQGMEGSLGYFVRGSNNGNNRLELDGVPVYGSTHLFGIVSTFHSDIIQNVNFYSGGFPATSGDFTSSLIQIKSIMPDTSTRHSKINLSPLFVGYSSNGKLTNKIGYVVAARYSLIGLEYQLLKSLTKSEMNFSPHVGDLYAKLSFGSPNNKMSISGYWSTDYLKYNFETSTTIINWGNGFVNFNWDKLYNPNLKLETSAYVNNFVTGQSMKMTEDKSEIKVQSDILEESVQSTLTYSPSNWKLDAGIKLKHRTYHPASEKILSGIAKINSFENSYSTVLSTLYANASYQYRAVTLSAGLRQNVYINGTDPAILFTDAKLNSIIDLNSTTSLNLSYDHISQTQHTLEGLPTGWSVDLIVPADSKLPIETTDQLYFGESTNFKSLSFSAGFFLKSMRNLVSYINTLSVFNPQNTSWKDEVTVGSGKSYGFECRMEKKGERFNGAVSYTWSKTDRTFSVINEGETFPFKFDRRNVLNLNAQFLFLKTKKTNNYLNFALSYSSGHRETVNIGQYSGYSLPYWNILESGGINYIMNRNSYYRQLMTSMNGYVLPYYLRVDVAYSRKFTKKKTTQELFVGVYNVLNRKNPYLIANDFGTWKQLCIFPIVPSVEWTISF